MKRLFSVFWLLALLPLFALEDYSKGIQKLDEILVASHDVTPLRYPNAEQVTIDDKIIIEYQKDGKSISWDDTTVKILTEKGRRNYRVLEFSYNQAYSTHKLTLLQIILEDGKVINLDPAKVCKTMTDPSQMGSNIYDPNDIILTANLPEVPLNSIVRYVIARETFKPRVPNSYSNYLLLEDTSPILRTSIELRAPKELPLTKIALLSPVNHTVSYTTQETPTHTHHLWVASNVPQAFTEPGMPRFSSCAQRVLVSTFHRWEEVSQWYWKLCAPHLTTSPALKAKVQELCAGKKDEMGKIRALFKFVSQEIRYMGETTETEAPGYEPHDAIQTFDKRHGVCRDKATLLAAMLREAGFEAFPVLIMAGPLLNEEVPLPYFNHAITAIRLNGTYILLDATNESTADLFPTYLSHKSYLVATPEGEKLLVSPIPSPDTNLMKINTTCTIDKNGALVGFATLKVVGLYDNIFRGSFLSMTPEQIERYFSRTLKNIIPGAALTNVELQPKDLQETDSPLGIHLNFTAPSIISTNQDCAFFQPLDFSNAFGMVSRFLGNTSLDKRRFPITFSAPFAVEEKQTLILAPEWGTPLSLPQYKSIHSNHLQWNRSVSSNENKLAFQSRMAFSTMELSPNEYLEFKKQQQIIEDNREKMPIYAPTAKTTEELPPPDMILLNDETEYRLQNETTWEKTVTIKKQLLTYNGKKGQAELCISFYPDVEKAELLYAKVTNGDTCIPFNLKEIKWMDAPWVASAPRYIPEKLLIANLPGVEINSIIEYQYKITSHQNKPFTLLTSFKENVPIQHKKVTLHYPKELPLKFTVHQNGILGEASPVNIQEEESSDETFITKTWSSFEQSQIKNETTTPQGRFYKPVLMVTCITWKQWAAELSEKLLAKTDANQKISEMGQKLHSLPPLKRVRAIQNFVSQNIRSAGPSFLSLPLDQLSSASQTLEEGYGNNADRAILTYALLKNANLTPEFLFVRPAVTSPETTKKMPDFADASLFSVILVRVKAEGTSCYLNTGDQYSELGTCPYDHSLFLSMNGKIDTLELPRHFKNKVTKTRHYTISDDGSAIVTTTSCFYGTHHRNFKKFYSELQPEERRRHYLSILSNYAQNATAESDLVTEFDSYPGKISYSVRMPSFAVCDDDVLYFNAINELSGHIPQGLEKRILPFELNAQSSFESTVSYTLPPQYHKLLFAPASAFYSLPGKNNTLKCLVKHKNDTITLKFFGQISPFFLTPEQYPDLMKRVREIEHPSHKKIILSK